MCEKLENSLRNFYITARLVCESWNKTVKDCLPVFDKIKVLAHQYDNAKNSNLANLETNCPNVKSKLLMAILIELENEMITIRNYQSILSELREDIVKSLDLIDRNQVEDLTSHTSQGVVVPPFYELIEGAENLTRHFITLYCEIDYSLYTIEYTDESISNTIKVFSKTLETNPVIQCNAVGTKCKTNFF